MPYHHPLAYLLGLEGLALLHAWMGEYDREFVLRRLAEVRRLIDHPALATHEGVEVDRRDTTIGYRQWSATYDEPRNTLFDVDEPVMHSILDSLPTGVALDAACGTGRFAAHLAARGHRVIGVDSSPEMLAEARRRVAEGEFHLGDLHDLPLPDGGVDLVVCGLALSHAPDLAPVMVEFARVLRPGGHLVISDTHHELVFRGSVVKALGPRGEPGVVPTYRHTPGDFLRAALPSGFEVRRCEEPGRPVPAASSPSGPARVHPPAPAADATVGEWEQWPWSLLSLVPEATRAAWAIPGVIVWYFQLAGR